MSTAAPDATPTRRLGTGTRPPNVFVVPAYNEAANLPRLFGDLEARPDLFPPASLVLIVDDGSQDATPELVEAYDGPLPVELVRLVPNQGPGAAFSRGFDAALAVIPDEGYVVTLEADTTSDLDAVPTMIRCAEDGAGLVLASVHGGGRMVNVSRLRQILSRGAGFTVRLGLGLDARTVSSFFRVYRASVLRAARATYGSRLIEERGFACKAELLAKISALGVQVDEVPVDLDASRRVGESKMRLLPTLAGYGRLLARQRRLAKGTVAG